MLTTTFDTAGPVRAQLTIRSADLTVTAADGTGVRVDLEPLGRDGEALAAETRVDLTGDRLVVDVPSRGWFLSSGHIRIQVTVPTGSSVEVRSTSGDVLTAGDLARLEVRTGSGDIDADVVGMLDLTTGSGDVTVGRADGGRVATGSGTCRLGRVAGSIGVRTGSGDVTVRHARDVDLATGSGDLVLEELDGSAHLRSGSGDLTVRRAHGGSLQAKTAAGDVAVGVAAGVATHLDCSSVTGALRSELDAGEPAGPDEPTFVVRATTVSGDVTVRRAR